MNADVPVHDGQHQSDDCRMSSEGLDEQNFSRGMGTAVSDEAEASMNSKSSSNRDADCLKDMNGRPMEWTLGPGQTPEFGDDRGRLQAVTRRSDGYANSNLHASLSLSSLSRHRRSF